MELLRNFLLLAVVGKITVCYAMETPSLAVQNLYSRLDTLSDKVMGAKKMQHLIDKATFKRLPIDGGTSVTELADILSRYFNATFNALYDFKNLLESTYADFDDNKKGFTECCHYPQEKLEFEPRLKALVDFSDTCYRVSTDSTPPFTIPSSKQLQQKFSKHFASNTFFKFQYYGTEEGIHVTFPARSKKDCGSYDPRYRPWYVATATPVAKDIVIVLDRSQSMAISDIMHSAREATKTVLDTLNANDRVGIVVFSSDALTPPGDDDKTVCMSESLAYTTSSTKAYLKRFLDTVKAYGGTNYDAALIKAFSLFEKTPDTGQGQGKRQKAILFLTDGKPSPFTPTLILDTIARLNAELENQVVILTFGFGEEIGTDGQELLRNMSRQTNNDPLKGTTQPGTFQMIDSIINLRKKLGSYYSQFSSIAQLDIPVITVPYVDYFELGLVLSVCLPVYHPAGVLRGVTAVDISIDDLIAQVAYFRHGENSYAFIIDNTGRTYMHPLLPNPYVTSQSRNGVFIDISALESQSEATDVIESMKRGGKGNKSFRTNLVQSRGNSRQRGVKTISVTATYNWRPISGTHFAVCFVVTEQDKQLKVEHTSKSRHFVYHRLDLLGLPGGMCQMSRKIATMKSSVVKFTGAAYRDTYRYFEQDEDEQDVRRIENYINGKGDSDSNFKEGIGIRQMVTLSESMDEIWTNQSLAVWYYVGFNNGVFRLYPGTVISKRFDHTTKHWYQTAVANRGKLCISTPYVDTLGRGLIISLSEALFEGRLSGTRTEEDILVGVISMDIRIADMRDILHDLFPVCAGQEFSCFVTDKGGFLVYHDDFLENSTPMHSIHIAQKEPRIAGHLIKNGYMKRQGCTALSTKRTYFSWEIVIDGVVGNSDGSPQYEMQYVDRTNIYMIVMRKSDGQGVMCQSCAVPKQDIYPDEILRCEREDDDICQCPCFIDVEFEYCQNRFSHIGDGYPACFPDNFNESYVGIVDTKIGTTSSLPACVPCEQKREMECGLPHAEYDECSWCVSKTENATEPSCHLKQQCRVTSTAGSEPMTNEDDDEKKSSIALISGLSAVGVVVAIVVIAFLSFYVIRRRRSDSDAATPTDSFFLPDNVSVAQAGSRDSRIMRPDRENAR